MQHSLSSENKDSISEISLEMASETRVRSKSFRNLLTFLKVLAGITLLFLTFRGIQVENLVGSILSADIAWLIGTLSMILLGLGLKLWRWRILLGNFHIKIGLSRLFSAYFVGQATNIILPFRGGELVRLGYFAEEKKIIPAATLTILLEKYLDLLALTACSILVSLKISLDNILDLRGFLLPITIIITISLLLGILFGPLLWEKIVAMQLLPNRLTSWVDPMIQATKWLKNPLQFFIMLMLTTFIWSIMWLTNLWLFTSLRLPLGVTAGGLVLVLVYIGLLPALMPGNIGPFYFFASLALVPFGILHESAVTYAVLLHALVTLPPLIGGLVGIAIHSQPPTNQ